VCPFKASGRCGEKAPFFDSYRGVCQHVANAHAHDGVATTYAESTIQDGTAKIPCPSGCGHLSVTHQKAKHHARNAGCTATKPTNMQCPWKKYNGCPKTGNANQMGTHQRDHQKDTRGPYQCSKAGCGQFSACLYHLAAHEENCKMKEANMSSTSYRFPLTKAAESRHPASIIIVNRSSSHPPKEWQAGTGSIHTGLPIVGRAILAHHIARTALPPTNVSAVLHSCSNCTTRQLPSLGINKSMSQDNLHQRLAFHRAFKFTMAITGDIQAANEAGIKPVLISVGLDGWACDERMLLPWLQTSALQFELVIHLQKLQYGMTDRFSELHGEIHWWEYQTQSILEALERGSGYDDKTDELIAAWKLLQSGKDVSFGVTCGRNFINTASRFPTID